MVNQRDYSCLVCGSGHGEPAGDESGQENWHWWPLKHGRIGPFCCYDHAVNFHFSGSGRAEGPEPRFTIKEIEWLLFMRSQHRQGDEVCQ